MNLTLIFGLVERIDEKNYKAQISLLNEDTTTPFLPILSVNASAHQIYSMPQKGDVVVALYDAKEYTGVILGSIYTEQNPPLNPKEQEFFIKFLNGTEIKHSPKGLEMQTELPITVKAQTADVKASSVLLKADGVNITADTQITGNLTVQGNIIADSVAASGIKLEAHKHSGVMGGLAVSGNPV